MSVEKGNPHKSTRILHDWLYMRDPEEVRHKIIRTENVFRIPWRRAFPWFYLTDKCLNVFSWFSQFLP